jgi:hypothetical protein
MSEQIVIQPPVPRAESVRARLADLAWEEGISAFVTNGVPFSFSSGRVLASGLADLVNALAMDRDQIRVMELGAGIGYLSSFSLDALKERFPEAYEKASFVVTDGAESVVRDAESQGVLSRHPDRAHFAVADLRDRSTILDEEPCLLVMSYLVDAIPPRHLERREDGVFTARIQTSIPGSLTLVDGQYWPPRALTASEISQLLQNPTDKLTPALARKIVPHLEEQWSWVPEETGQVPGVMLNSRSEAVLEICSVLADMPAESAVVVTDFGYTVSEEIPLNEMMTEYGLCAFWAVAFDEIQEIAASYGFTTMIQAGDEGETHTLLIYKGENTDLLCRAFQAGFEDMVSDRPRYVLYNLEEDCTLEDVHAAIEKIESTMPADDVDSYGNLARFAHLLLQFGDVTGAVGFAKRCVTLFPEVAAPEMTILGSAEGRSGNLAAAEVLFKRALDVAPALGNAHLGLSGVYKARQDWDGYFTHIVAYLQTANCDEREVMAGIAETLAETPLTQVADEAKQWLLDH